MTNYLNFRSFFRISTILSCFVLLVAACAAPSEMGLESSPMEAVENRVGAEVMEQSSDSGESAQVMAYDDAVAQADGAVMAGIQRKVIARANVDLVVQDVTATVAELNQLMDEIGGYVADTNLYKSSYEGEEMVRGSLRLRVPAELVDDLLAQLEAMAVEVESKNITREDVTDQYADVQAQLRNLEATENELRELLSEVRAKPNATPEDILAVHRSLTEIRGQIEQIQGRKNMLDNLISLATIEVSLTPDTPNRPIVQAGWQPGIVVQDALRMLVDTVQVLGNVMIWVILYIVPSLLLVLLPLVIVFVIIRSLIRRRSARKEA